MRWAAYVACMGEGRGAYRVLVRKLDRKNKLVRTRCRLSFMIFIPHRILLGDQIKNETDGVCSKYGGQERCIQGFGGETWL
jgi:hypothetical protein